ncbi:hypothetical protein LX16_4530 [Stackebrandtia albiflava]|uniref:Ribonuclease VapC n=1 Tax=Stackebrandtia albiflava TaxID=406432 RepID=A0A562URQ7_9ACTN|nr:type II toxin-antitoxin system VapC family toxin [Stackebrandtia albiflava]TWJ08305.1 hypothetical protein LX16_4530 [Stackebrandtia albiflava]
MSYLVDTNVISELRKTRPSHHVMTWYDHAGDAELFFSVLTLAELRVWEHRLRLRDERAADSLRSWLARMIEFDHRLLPVTREICELWARMNVPDRLPIIDGFLAATARYHGLTVVTGNVKDFARTGVPVLDPFAPR